jgi:cyclopropane fatty-acyl-phospholipid synthase-like methyltransferase
MERDIASGAARTLTTSEARAFYDRFGAKQDSQAFYEDPALDALIAHADFEHARSVFEFGCGTGRLASRLLATVLPEDCRYLGVDVSETMIGLARERLQPWAGRASVVHSDGRVPSQCEAGAYDRFVATYVLDLLSDDAIRATFVEAHRLLMQEGRLGVVGLTHGRSPATKLVSSAWALVHRLKPSLVGGCRPIELRHLLPEDRWRIGHHGVVTAWGISSEVLVAVRGAP